MIIVLDSNIWLRELGLNSSLGAATRFYIRHNNARLAVPEVVRLEVEHTFRSKMKEFAKEVADNHRQLLTTFGALKEVVLPTDEDIDKKAQDIIANVGVELVDIEFSIESARSSFLKTIMKVPPSDRSQQFKDGVLWADCCRLLEDDDVCLVTEDKAFFAGHEYRNGLAANLSEEASTQQHTLRVFSSLSDLLKEIVAEVTLDVDLLVSSFIQQHKTSIEGTVHRNGFQLGDRLSVSKSLYATERPNALYLSFTAEFACDDVTGEDRVEGRLLLKGDGNYNIDEKSFTDLRNLGEELSFRLQDGADRVVRNIVLAVGSIVIGHKEIVHTVRHPLD